MLVGIDASRATVAHPTGTEIYSLHLTRHLLRHADAHRFRLYFRDAPPPGLFANAGPYEARVIRASRLWTHLGLRRELRRDPPDVLFVPAHVVPVGCRVPAVVTVHDLGYLHFPRTHRLTDRLYLDWSTRHSARAATHVVTDSESTRRDLVARYRVPPDKITVAYPGINPAIQPVRDPSTLKAARARYTLPERYILHVGTLQPRKNLSRLVQAYAQLRAQLADPPALVLAGGKGWLYDDLFAEVERLGLGGHVHFPGRIPGNEDLAALYSGAQVFAFPSLFEGFGFPLLEAMRCGTPAVCSDVSSLPELAGEAALTFPPTDVDALAAALLRVLTDDGLRAGLVESGFAQAARFTWEACAGAVWTVLEEAAGGRYGRA